MCRNVLAVNIVHSYLRLVTIYYVTMPNTDPVPVARCTRALLHEPYELNWW